MRTLRVAGVVLALSLALAGCASSTANPGTAAFPTASSQAGAAGTALPDGLRVPKGARLLIPVFVEEATFVPRPGDPDTLLRRWGASMAVTGPPIEAFNDLVRTADAAGYGLEGRYGDPQGEQPGDESCAAESNGRHVPLAEVSGDIDLFRCVAETVIRDYGSADSSLTISLDYGQRDGVPQRFLSVRYSQVGSGDRGDPALPPPTYDGPVPMIDAPTDWAFPGTGDTFTDASGIVVVTVEQGSRLLAPPVLERCVTGGLTAFFAVTGDPGEVVELYHKQFIADRLDGSTPVEHGTEQGLEYWTVSASSAGGVSLDAHAFADKDGKAWLTVGGCND